MINAWSLAYEVLFGNMDETYPIREDVPEDLWDKKIDTSVGAGNTAMNWSTDQNPYYEDDDGLDYEIDLTADVDDQRMHILQMQIHLIMMDGHNSITNKN